VVTNRRGSSARVSASGGDRDRAGLRGLLGCGFGPGRIGRCGIIRRSEQGEGAKPLAGRFAAGGGGARGARSRVPARASVPGLAVAQGRPLRRGDGAGAARARPRRARAGRRAAGRGVRACAAGPCVCEPGRRGPWPCAARPRRQPHQQRQHQQRGHRACQRQRTTSARWRPPVDQARGWPRAPRAPQSGRNWLRAGYGAGHRAGAEGMAAGVGVGLGAGIVTPGGGMMGGALPVGLSAAVAGPPAEGWGTGTGTRWRCGAGAGRMAGCLATGGLEMGAFATGALMVALMVGLGVGVGAGVASRSNPCACAARGATANRSASARGRKGKRAAIVFQGDSRPRFCRQLRFARIRCLVLGAIWRQGSFAS
jgi:hypothetical protein